MQSFERSKKANRANCKSLHLLYLHWLALSSTGSEHWHLFWWLVIVLIKLVPSLTWTKKNYTTWCCSRLFITLAWEYYHRAPLHKNLDIWHHYSNSQQYNECIIDWNKTFRGIDKNYNDYSTRTRYLGSFRRDTIFFYIFW